MIAEDGNFNFTSGNGFLNENFHRKLASKIQRGGQFFARVDFGHADGRAEGGGLHENGITELQLDGALNCLRVAFPIVTVDGDPGHDRNFRDLKQALGDVFVHANGGAEDSSADEGKACEVEQTLDRAVFAEVAVHHGKTTSMRWPPPLPSNLTSAASV